MKLARVGLLAASLAVSACSVRLVATSESVVTTNRCATNSDCGSGAACSAGICVTKSGQIDDVLLEIVPDATSSSVGGLTFLSPQTGVGQGSRDLGFTLKPAPFLVQVRVRGDDLAPTCPYPRTSTSTIPATVEFARGSTSGEFAISSLPRSPVSVDTRTPQSSSVTLSPGTYDVYIQPKSSADCPLAPRILRGVEVASVVDPSAPPALLSLPKPLTLGGRVTTGQGSNASETLAGWQVDLIEPLDGRVISTTGGWPEGSPIPSPTNFSIVYQPVSVPPTGSSSTPDVTSPILRMRPPDSLANKAPTVYWALSAIDLDGNGTVSLDLSGLPSSDQLVNVTGHVLAASGEGIAATVQFLSLSLNGTKGLTASFNQFTNSDATGAYSAQLYPGQYKLVAAPSPDRSGGLANNATSNSTITTKTVTVQPGSGQPADFTLFARPVVTGRVSAGFPASPALGAMVEAVPVISASAMGVWRSALAQTPIVPDPASVAVNSADGSFNMSLDPGTFDFSVRPGDGSNFAWWVSRQDVAISGAGQPVTLEPHLPFPVPIEGTLDFTDMKTAADRPLANAVIRAYAKVPGSSEVTKVGDARTDLAGHYLLLLPPSIAP